MEIYVEQFVVFILIFVRVTSLLVTAPLFGYQAFPPQIKIGLGIFLSFILFSFNAKLVSTIELNLLGLFLLTLKEAIAGASIGFAMGIIFAGVRYAGELIGYDMGLSMATMFNPESNASFPVLSEMLYFFLLMIFLLVNGHHFIIESLQASYSVIPIGKWTIGEAGINKLISMTGQLFVVAVKIAAPVIVSLFLVNVSLGILNKVMPQMNIFSVIFSLKIGVGLVVLSATIPVIAFVFKKILTVFQSSILDLMKAM